MKLQKIMTQRTAQNILELHNCKQNKELQHIIIKQRTAQFIHTAT
jgi:hypothetical protein